MKKEIVLCLLLSIVVSVFAQNNNRPSLKFNSPYVSNNRTVVLPSDRIPSDFLGCTLGVTNEVDALKNLNQLGIRYSSSSKVGVSDVINIFGDIECEGAKFRVISLWFYNNIFWKIAFINLQTDSKVLENIINKKYSRFPRTAPDRNNYSRYRGNNTDLVYNGLVLQYMISGGSIGQWGEE